MNGFKDKVFNNPSKIESIELVLEDLEKMNIVSYFKNLKNITLINVGITAIEVILIDKKNIFQKK
jgi:hypothetical protein